jgi:hypothetical protein
MIYWRPINCWFKVNRDLKKATIGIDIEFRESIDMFTFEERSMKYEMSGELMEKLGWLIVKALEYKMKEGEFYRGPEFG